jgi:hypothetical protein
LLDRPVESGGIEAVFGGFVVVPGERRKTLMARLSKKNPAYRTKDQLLEDVAFVLNSPLSYGTKYVVCKQATSAWTEHEGKYKGCGQWSKKAFKQYEATASVKGLRHEHAIPKKVVLGALLNLHNPTKANVALWFKLLVAVVVTVEEDRLLNSRFKSSVPPEFYDSASPSGLDMLLRYKECGIEVLEVKW